MPYTGSIPHRIEQLEKATAITNARLSCIRDALKGLVVAAKLLVEETPGLGIYANYDPKEGYVEEVIRILKDAEIMVGNDWGDEFTGRSASE